jgi:membrane protease YdiL (CAAX protease family)
MGSPPATRANPWNAGQMIVWVLLLFLFTILGALPLVWQGLTLSTISQSTPHLPLVMTGMLVTSCAPTLAAIFVAWLYPGAGGVRSIFRQVMIWRVGRVWYAAALAGPIALFLIVQALNALGLGGRPALRIGGSFGGPGGLSFVVFGSLLAEEPGWRGFAQPRLQARFGALAAAILIGVLWSTWHLWYVITPGGFGNVTDADAAATYIRLTSTAIIYAWMYNSTRGSLLIAMLAHVGHNLAAGLIPTPDDGGWRHLTIAVAYLVVAIAVVSMTDRRTLCRRARTRTNEETVTGQGSAG